MDNKEETTKKIFLKIFEKEFSINDTMYCAIKENFWS